VGGAGPLAVDDFVKVIRVLDVGRLQQKLQAANFSVQGRGPVNDGLEYRIWVAHWGYLVALRQGFCVANGCRDTTIPHLKQGLVTPGADRRWARSPLRGGTWH
jgi:hypothetical protein